MIFILARCAQRNLITTDPVFRACVRLSNVGPAIIDGRRDAAGSLQFGISYLTRASQMIEVVIALRRPSPRFSVSGRAGRAC
jgi:hypothetical protein